MAEEKHHHLFHHKEEEEEPSLVYSDTINTHDYKKEEREHKRHEHLAELGTAAAGIYAVHEKHKAGKDTEHAHRHKIEEEVAAAVAVGSGGYAFHEHHERKEAKEEDEEAHGKKKHHLF